MFQNKIIHEAGKEASPIHTQVAISYTCFHDNAFHYCTWTAAARANIKFKKVLLDGGNAHIDTQYS